MDSTNDGILLRPGKLAILDGLCVSAVEFGEALEGAEDDAWYDEEADVDED